MSADPVEAERRRAARDIHDRLGYWLSLAHVELGLLDLHQHRDPGRAATHLTATRQAIAEGLGEIRRMVTELRSSRTVESLEKELRIAADATAPGAALVPIVVNGDDQHLSDHVRGELFLVLREALRNAFAHSGCLTVSVRVDISTARVRAAVIDDGRGFAPHRVARGGGLASMRERVELLGGAMSITAAPGRGCSVEIMLPVSA